MTDSRVSLLAVALALVFSACSSNRFSFERHQSDATAESAIEMATPVTDIVGRIRALENEMAALAPTKKWAAQLTGTSTVQRAWLRDGTLLLEALNGATGNYEVYSIDARKGSSRWMITLNENRLARAPRLSNNSIALLTENDNGIVLINAVTGSRIQNIMSRFQGVASSDAVSSLATVYVGDYLTERLTTAAADGRRGWNFYTVGPVTGAPILTTGLPNQLLITGTREGQLAGIPAQEFNETSPSPAWTRTFSSGFTADLSQMMAGDAPLVLAPCEDGAFYGITPATGRSAWPPLRTNAPFSSEAQHSHGRIYVRNSERMFCLDAKTGKRLWWPKWAESLTDYEKLETFGTPEGFELCDRLVAANADRVFLMRGATLVKCNADTGEIDGEFALNSFDFVLSNEVGGEIIAGTRDGVFVSFE